MDRNMMELMKVIRLMPGARSRNWPSLWELKGPIQGILSKMWCRPYCIHVWIKIAINRLLLSIFFLQRVLNWCFFTRPFSQSAAAPQPQWIIVDSTLQAINNPMVSTWETDKPWVFTFRHPSSGKQMVWRFYVTRPSDLQYLTMPNVPTVPTMLYIHIYIHIYICHTIPFHTIPYLKRGAVELPAPAQWGAEQGLWMSESGMYVQNIPKNMM
jgi:hypothetical protein